MPLKTAGWKRILRIREVLALYGCRCNSCWTGIESKKCLTLMTHDNQKLDGRRLPWPKKCNKQKVQSQESCCSCTGGGFSPNLVDPQDLTHQHQSIDPDCFSTFGTSPHTFCLAVAVVWCCLFSKKLMSKGFLALKNNRRSSAVGIPSSVWNSVWLKYDSPNTSKPAKVTSGGTKKQGMRHLGWLTRAT